MKRNLLKKKHRRCRETFSQLHFLGEITVVESGEDQATPRFTFLTGIRILASDDLQVEEPMLSILTKYNTLSSRLWPDSQGNILDLNTPYFRCAHILYFVLARISDRRQQIPTHPSHSLSHAGSVIPCRVPDWRNR